MIKKHVIYYTYIGMHKCCYINNQRLYFIIHDVIIKMLRGVEAIRNQNRKVIYMLDVLNNKVELSNVHFTEHKLTIEDAKAMLENEGWIATK